MISSATRSLGRTGAVHRATLSCLSVLASRRTSTHVIPAANSRLLDTKPLECLSTRSISFNLIEKATKKQRLNYGGTVLYEGIADKLNYQYFFDQFQLDDTFVSWFLITEMHVWMLMLRLMQEGDEGLKVRNFMVETMWEDVQVRSKKLGHPNPSLIKKQLAVLSEEFNASIMGYDEASQQSDSILAGHLWRRFFSCEKVHPVLLEKLVHYIRRQLFMLSHISRAELINMNPRIDWVYI